MFKKLNHAGTERKGRIFAVAAVFALTIASLSALVAPQKAAAYSACSGNSCSLSVEECLAKNPRPLLKVNGVPDRKCTAAVQGFMNEVYSRGISVDGSYGDQTAITVAWFQIKFDIGVDGKVGPATWQKIRDVCTWIYAYNENQACFSRWSI